MVVPNFVEQALKGEELIVHGDGQQSRCFCHVQDVVQALIKLVDAGSCFGQVFNVGSTEEISIQTLAEQIIEQTGSDSQLRLIPYSEAYGEGFEDMRRRIPSLSRIHKAIGWSPSHSISEIIEDVVSDVKPRLTGGAVQDTISG